MKVARVRRRDFARPTLALECDGSLYDVAELEARSRAHQAEWDFFERVVASRGAGLDATLSRLRAGLRPTEARIQEADCLRLPPLDPSRSAYVQLGPAEATSPEPAFQLRDARAVVGDGQPVPVHGDPKFIDAGLAVILGDDLESATSPEVRAAVLGFTLVIEWCADDAWGSQRPPPISQLGSTLVLGSLRSVEDATLTISDGETCRESAPIGCRTWAIEDAVSYLSHFVALRAGDVVGVGRAVNGRMSISSGRGVVVKLGKTLSLSGYGVGTPPPTEWRSSRTTRD